MSTSGLKSAASIILLSVSRLMETYSTWSQCLIHSQVCLPSRRWLTVSYGWIYIDSQPVVESCQCKMLQNVAGRAILFIFVYAGEEAEGYDNKSTESLAQRNSEHIPALHENINHPMIKRVVIIYRDYTSMTVSSFIWSSLSWAVQWTVSTWKWVSNKQICINQ